MILRRAERLIARELLVTQTAVTVVLLLVIIGGVLGRVLRDVAEGSIPVDFLPGMVAFGAFKGIVFLWPVALFLAFMLVLGRLQRDSELVALQASGMSFAAFYRALFWVAAPATLLLLVLMTLVVPRTEAQIDQLRDLAETRSDLVGITPGRFLRSRVGEQVFFAERLSEDREALLEVFIYREVDGEAQVTVAERAIPDPGAEGSGFLILENGYRHVGVPGEGSFRMLEFERLRTQITEPDAGAGRRSLNAMSTLQLWAERDRPDHRAELEWRIAMPLSILVLTLIALPLAQVPPRTGRYARIPAAIGVYVLYANFLILGQGQLADGRTPLALGLWWTHGLMLVLWLWLAWRKGMLGLGRGAGGGPRRVERDEVAS
ncbi:LPS export ABC transporter permease LptF [Thioalkalivibrio sp. AKL6]|uniref:LPS export ABC transporter permease LptF n=1 Tax=Thioalkalivibrio sp. AKL6 TaxID=1158154 RepID=UPI00036542E8|nr:LPS export ABC transporter permease LptF [Thioalkalivibrio sp. AKL6]